MNGTRKCGGGLHFASGLFSPVAAAEMPCGSLRRRMFGGLELLNSQSQDFKDTGISLFFSFCGLKILYQISLLLPFISSHTTTLGT